jgi:hypothetical protein
MLEICTAVLQKGINEVAPFECVPRMLLVWACFGQARGPDQLPLVAEAVSFFHYADPGSAVWSAALVVVLSGIIVSVFAPDCLEVLLGLVNLTSWYECGASNAHLSFNRLLVMSIAGFMVLAMRGDALALQTFVPEMANLTHDEPGGPPEAWDDCLSLLAALMLLF